MASIPITVTVAGRKVVAEYTIEAGGVFMTYTNLRGEKIKRWARPKGRNMRATAQVLLTALAAEDFPPRRDAGRAPFAAALRQELAAFLETCPTNPPCKH